MAAPPDQQIDFLSHHSKRQRSPIALFLASPRCGHEITATLTILEGRCKLNYERLTNPQADLESVQMPGPFKFRPKKMLDIAFFA